ncbi:MAG: glycosyltransferase [Pseudomonadota bacterium]
MRTALILSPHFPPSTLAGVHRARHLAKGLPLHGWRPVVLHADPRDYEEPGDPALADLVPDSVEQVAVRLMPAALTRPFGVGDIGLRGFRAYGHALRKAAAKFHPDVVLLTGSPFYPFLLSSMVRDTLGLPVVLDFQDPWVSDEGRRRQKWTKPWASHKLAEQLEPRAVRHASAITSVSETQNEQMRARYPDLRDIPMAAIPIGGDPDDFDALRRAPPQNPNHRLEPGKFHLSFVGTYMPRTEPVMNRVFEAVRMLRDRDPGLADRVRLNFVGTSNQPGPVAHPGPVSGLARQWGISDMVSETPGRVPFLEALSILANSDGILLVGSDEPHYTASKIYPALMSGRPYASVFHAASSANGVLRSAGGGIALSFDGEAELAGLAPAIADAVEIHLNQSEVSKADPSAYSDYTAVGVAGAFADLFSNVAPHTHP